MHVVVMGLNDGVMRLEQTDDRWLAGDFTPVGSVESMAVDSTVDGRVYAGAGEEGLWRSDDGGRSWEKVGAGIDRPVVTTVAVSSMQSGSDGAVVYVGTQLSALFRSLDGGRTFEELKSFQDIPSRPNWATPPAPDTHHVCSIVADPPGGDGILLIGLELAGVVRSTDGGETWDDVVAVADPDPHSLAVHPGAEGRIYLAGGVSYCESNDFGANWERAVDGFEVCYFDKMAVDPDDPSNVVISAGREPFTGHGVFPSAGIWSTLYRRSEGTDWGEVTDGLPPSDGTAMGFLATNPIEGGTFYYATLPGELYRSEDGGSSWARAEHESIGAHQVTALACAEVSAG
jgi:photosystem II stability/assembly factor-like uncharacterized protein